MSPQYHIELSERVFHFKQPAGTSRGVYTDRRVCFLSLGSPQWPGIIGVGECAPLPDLSCDMRPDYAAVLAKLCQDFCQSGEIDYERLRPYPSMLFGLETALLHLQHQVQQLQEDSLSVPLQQNGGPATSFALSDTLFGRGEAGIPINGLVWMGSFDQMYHRIQEKLSQGFRCIKLKIGAIDWQKELELIRFVRKQFPKEQVELRVDANGGFTPEEAPGRLEQLSRYDIHSIEQPIRQHQWQAMARLCRESPVPIALDEELIGIHAPEEKARLLDTIRPHYIILKPSLHGGMSGSREWIAMARARGIGSWMTSALESNVGLNAIAHLAAELYGPHFDMAQGLGTGQLFTDNVPVPLEVRGDRLWLSTAHE